MDREVIAAMKEFCIRILKGGPEVGAQEMCSLPKVLEILERHPDKESNSFKL